jgi:hypothetical protein
MRGAILIASFVFFSSLAHAQATRSGPTFSLGGTTSPVEQPDVAYDSVNNRYLQVAGKVFIEGHLLNSTGGIISTFRVNDGAEYAQAPRVAFGADIAGGGGYLVTWHVSLGAGNTAYAAVRGRIIRADGAPLTGDFTISTAAVSPATQSNWTMGAAVAYATGSKEFLVAWMGNYGTTNDIFFQRVSPSGALLGASTRVSAGTADWERDPSVAYNPIADEFYVAYAGYLDAGGYGYAAGQRVKAGTGLPIGGVQQFGTAVSTYVPAVTFNTGTNQYLLGWYNRTRTGAAVYGVVLSGSDASQVGDIRVLSPYYSAYDALDIDYNAPSGQYLLVTHGAGTYTWEDAAVSILSNGTAYDNGFIVTHTEDVRPLRTNPSANDGNFNPRMTSSVADKKWLLVTSSVFVATHAQFVSTDAAGGTPPPPPPTTPDTRLFVDSPQNGGTYAGRVLVQGWAVDTAAASGTGVDAVHVWAFPVSGAPGFLVGAATMGLARLDVASYLGDSRFTNSGYQIVARLAPGTYDLGVYARSTVANAFNTVKVIRVVVTAPPSEPYMVVDQPAVGQYLSQNILVSGWAVDLAAQPGPGVDAVHVWAYPIINGVHQPAVWVGAATVGVPRGDVAAAFGVASLTSSGYVLSGTLPRGDYDLVVFARSTVTLTFNNWIVVRIHVI